MIAQLISDLHTEFYYGDSLDMLRRIQFIPNLDFLLLPGDIVVPAHQPKEEMRTVFEFLASKAQHVLLTFGNHEYYSSKVGAAAEAKIREVLPDNVHLLGNSEILIDGTVFYGGALWFKDDPLNQLYERQLNDFNLIGDIRSWVYQKNAEFRENGRKLIRPETIVLSHHLPSPICVAEPFRGSELNRFFVSDETDLILDKQPRYWVAGHSHTPFDGTLGKTRIVLNPMGYPHERGRKPYPPVVFEV